MSCAVRRPFPLLAWSAIPVLFTAAVLGLTSLGELLLGLPGDTVLTSAHLGASAAVTAIVGLSIEWRPNLRSIRWAYPVVVFVLGIVLHGTEIPTVMALATGLPSAAILTRTTYLHRFSREQDQKNRRSTLVSGLSR